MIQHCRQFLLLALAGIASASYGAEDPVYRWNLADMYATQADWDKDAKALESQFKTLTGCSGQLTQSTARLKACLDLRTDATKRLYKLASYAFQSNDQDTGDTAGLDLKQRADVLQNRLQESTSFFAPEFLKAGRTKVEGLMKKDKRLAIYKHGMDDLWRTAAAGAISGLISSSQSSSLSTPLKVLLATALNVAAARIEGVKNGRQLLLVGALSGAAAYATSNSNGSNQGPEGKPAASVESLSKAFIGAIIGVGLGRVIGNNVRGPTGQALATFAATLVEKMVSNNIQAPTSDDDQKKINALPVQTFAQTLHALNRRMQDLLTRTQFTQ